MRSEMLSHAIGNVVLAAVISLGVTAGAGAVEVSQQQREACTPDAFRLCSAEIPDVSRITACMEANKARLSAPCRAVFEAVNVQAPTAPAIRKRHPGFRHFHRKLRHYANYRED